MAALVYVYGSGTKNRNGLAVFHGMEIGIERVRFDSVMTKFYSIDCSIREKVIWVER